MTVDSDNTVKRYSKTLREIRANLGVANLFHVKDSLVKKWPEATKLITTAREQHVSDVKLLQNKLMANPEFSATVARLNNINKFTQEPGVVEGIDDMFELFLLMDREVTNMFNLIEETLSPDNLSAIVTRRKEDSPSGEVVEEEPVSFKVTKVANEMVSLGGV